MFSALVVDDDPHVCALTSRALGRYRFNCQTASDGEQALAACNNALYDVVVTDLRMPRRHGHSLAVELLSRNPRPRVVVLTGLVEPKLVQDLVIRGVDEVVQKPANFESLAQSVLRIVAKSRQQSASPSPKPQPLKAKAKSSYDLLREVELSLVELTEIFAERLEGVFDVGEELSDPPSAVTNFITRQAEIEAAAEASHAGLKSVHEARDKARIRCDATALAVPVNGQFAPVGEPFKLAVRDISESGVRLLHTRATNAKFLALCWSAETQPMQQLSVVARVMRCRPLSPFYDIGGQFVLAD
ncbi:MAG: response regulator [Planctomycetota bacterium]